MFQTLVVVSLVFLRVSSKMQIDIDYEVYEVIDPTKYDYCQHNCDPKAKSVDDGKGLHAACDCSVKPPRELYNMTDIVAFRQEMLDLHNHYRNFSAGGNEKRPENDSIPAAADMEVMSYDLELEYIVMCRALNSYGETTNPHEPCGLMSKGRRYCQNLSSSTLWYAGKKKGRTWNHERLEVGWYEEVKFLYDSRIVHKFDMTLPTKGKIGHWTAMMWGSLNRVGCVTVYIPNHARKAPSGKSFAYHLMCDYANKRSLYSCNVGRQKIFTVGEPCSKCPSDTKCNSKYTALCGDLEPVPTAPMYEPHISASTKNWRYYKYCGIGVFLLNYTLYFLFYNLFL